MTIKMRRFVVVVPAAAILLLANALNLGEWLDGVGAVGWARSIRTEYFTGTAITVIAALLILLPSSTPRGLMESKQRLRCPVCDESLRPGGRYCAACGSRV